MEKHICLILWTGILIVHGTNALDLVKSGNEYMDKILATTVRRDSDALDTVRLPSFETNNRDKFLFINVKVKTSYSNGRLRNLGKVIRLGDCMPENDYPVIKLSCTVQFKDLRVDYSARMKYGQLPKISVTAKATVRPVEAHVVISNNTVPRTLKLETFDLVTPVEIDPAFTGIGLLNRYLKMLKDNFVGNAGHYVEHAIKKEFGAALNHTIINTSSVKS